MRQMKSTQSLAVNINQKLKCSTTTFSEVSRKKWQPMAGELVDEVAEAGGDNEEEDAPFIDLLFATMACLFGEKFTGRFPTEESLEMAKKIWELELKDLTDEQFRVGVERCKEWESNFAPDLNQFRRMCLEPPRPVPQMHVALPRPERTESQVSYGESHIAKMRAAIAKVRVGNHKATE